MKGKDDMKAAEYSACFAPPVVAAALAGFGDVPKKMLCLFSLTGRFLALFLLSLDLSFPRSPSKHNPLVSTLSSIQELYNGKRKED